MNRLADVPPQLKRALPEAACGGNRETPFAASRDSLWQVRTVADVALWLEHQVRAAERPA